MNDEIIEFESVTRVDYSSLQISLYFFLLIFFVLIDYIRPTNNFAVVEETTAINNKSSNNSLIEEDLLTEKKKFISDITDFYRAQLLHIIPTNFQVILSDNLEFLQIHADVNAFFQDKTNDINKLSEVFLADLAKILSMKIHNNNLTLNIALGTRDLEESNSELTRNLERIAEIAGYLVSNGAESKYIETAILSNAQHIIVFSLKLL